MRSSTKLMVGCAAAIVVVVALVLIFRPHVVKGPTTAAVGGNSPIPVLAAPATAEDVPIILRGLGAVTAFNTVALKSRVGGNIIRINFTEGQEVKAGDLLIELDARPFQAVLDQANATLARDEANLKNAQADLARYAQLVATQQRAGAAIRNPTSHRRAGRGHRQKRPGRHRRRQAQRRVRFDPLAHRWDRRIRQIDIGNLVQANSQPLAIITQIKPIYVIFSLTGGGHPAHSQRHGGPQADRAGL